MDTTYGKVCMYGELQALGFDIGLHRVRTSMKRLGLIAKRPKQHKYPVGAKPSVIALNYLNRQFNPQNINKLWSGDITYIRTQQGWLYLAVIMDLCSHKVISWASSDKPNSELTTRALRLAVNKRQPIEGVLFHSDQVMQYTCEAFQRSLKEHGIVSRMSRAGNCLDNAVTERFFRSLSQTELTIVVIKQDVKQWLILLIISSRFIIRSDDIIN